MTAEEAVLWKLTGLCVDSLHDLEYAARLVAGLDLALARAKYTSWVDGTLPEFVSMQPTSRSDGHEEGHGVQGTLMDKGQALTNGAAENSSSDGFLVRLERFRHPLLLGEFLLHRKKVLRRERMPGELFEEDDILRPPVAVDVRFRPQTKAVVITGSNTGGKTCSIKGVGLAALMARAGLGIPAEPPVLLPCYSAVLADIGDEQSLTSSLSTFSGHLARIQALRKEADGNCLVLLDEVGTGTDAEEGAALGAALLMELVKGGQGGALTVLATTHHAVLTTLAYRDPLSRFENASVEFDEERLVPTYRLLWGIPGRSNALEIGARLGMPHEIVEAAKARLGDGETGISAVIKQLEVVERQRRQGRDELRKFDLQVAKLKQDRDRLSYKVSGLQQQEHAAKRRMYSSILSEARTKLRQIRREQQLKSQLPASKRNVGATSTARREQKQTQSAARMKEQQAAKSREDLDAETEWDPRVGDVVYVPKLGSNARIVGTGPGEKLEVQAGSFMRLTVTKDAISRAK
ncbi:unnamed protein product [Ostreobium quekettii]|uniref:DNA mismatch repair proteins mutS family domain-containing protein n=1 Tax=Ostreobium quekettii TaxID=121088 RepID=A0A8S1IY55_9CHLO|nr:unnamed protein product [Ostreobium quekettii]|eukprot:evm.model.scf_982EXC.5 EVM.evm.TU.scf_982EXC.5   scf_982EXC:21268-26341(+)